MKNSQKWNLRREIKQNKNIILFSLLIFFVLVISFILYFTSPEGYEVFGLVKPITFLQYGGFLLFGLLLNLFRKLFYRLDKKTLNILILLGFFVMMAAFFETIWAFDYWFTIQGANEDVANTEVLDAVSYVPHNQMAYDKFYLNTSAKKNTLLLFCAIYFVYFCCDIKRSKFS